MKDGGRTKMKGGKGSEENGYKDKFRERAAR